MNRMICTLKYGKYTVNGIHICNRQYLIDKMCLVGTREAEDSTKRLEAHYMIGDSRSRFIEEYKRLFQDNIRLNQMKSENKYKKMKIQ